MIYTAFVLWVFIVLLSIGMFWNVVILKRAFAHWRRWSAMNGAEHIIVVGMLRRPLLRALRLACWLTLFVPRTIWDVPLSPLVRTIVAAVIIVAETADVLADEFDWRLLQETMPNEPDA